MPSARTQRMFGTMDNLREAFRRLTLPQWQRNIVSACHGKHKFVSKKEAIDHRNKIDRYKRRLVRIGVYKCEVCDHFHLAHKEKD